MSHAHNKKRKRFLPNLHSHRFWHPAQKRFVRLKVSAKAIRIIDKYGIEAVLDSMINGKKLSTLAAAKAAEAEAADAKSGRGKKAAK